MISIRWCSSCAAHDPPRPGFRRRGDQRRGPIGSVWLWHKAGDQWPSTRSSRSGRAADPDVLPPACSRSVRCHRWSRTSISPSTTGGCTYPVGRQVNSNNSTSATHSIRRRRRRFARGDRAAPTASVGARHAAARRPQMVEISRDGRRVYVTNSLYAAWDEVFYPEGVGAWMAKLDADVSAGVWCPTPASSRTASSSAGCGCTKRGCRA
ncbi:56kDa selenium binding family protein [Mycobacterium xenopi 4042]|uniref:56kDa selenium binding family protein n=1 Tax=Mycobacterium xenopi 4042 TaxID=1299334 RepID=X8AH35_MYCXE|nr:56kDa selenium binding family protein [Mycobacterium xenopi 4042]